MTPVTPMAILGLLSYGNNWYNSGGTTVANVKPLLFAGIAALILEAGAAIPGGQGVATAIGWTALLAYVIAPGDTASPLQNIFNIAQGKGK